MNIYPSRIQDDLKFINKEYQSFIKFTDSKDEFDYSNVSNIET